MPHTFFEGFFEELGTLQINVLNITPLNKKHIAHTSTNPCAIFSSTTAVGPIDMAPGMAMLKMADAAMAAPKILLAGYIEARNPPGTCVMRYPAKYEESMDDSTSTVQLKGVSS